MRRVTKKTRNHVDDLRGASRLAVEATKSVTELVEAMHLTIGSGPAILGRPLEGPVRLMTGMVYKTIRGVTHLVGTGIDTALAQLGPLLGDSVPSAERETVLAALNGVLGDYLAASANPLAIGMCLRATGSPLEISKAALTAAFPRPGRRLLVLAHGLCMNDLQWTREGHDHGAAIARDLGYTPVYLHYNTGRHISTNGRDFADLLETLLREWPHPIERLTLMGHSMGGLVAHSACVHAARVGHAWVERLDHLVFLGTPHFGAPLERAGTRVDFLLRISPYSAPFVRLGKIRSAGIRDLGHGYRCDEDWQEPTGRRPGRVPPALPAGVRCYAIAASRQARPGTRGGPMRGDGFVPVSSALGTSRDGSVDLGVPAERQWVGFGIGHFDLLGRAEVYERIRSWLADGRAAA